MRGWKGTAMLKKNITGFIVVGCALTMVFAKDVGDEARLLTVDYAGKQQCSYLAEYTSQGSFTQKGIVSKKSTSVRCVLFLSAAGPKRLSIKADSIFVGSDVFDEKMQKDLRKTLKKATYSLSLEHGFPEIDSASVIPTAGYAAWDLYRHLSKLLPALPDKPVKPGFTWERTVTLPLQTTRGIVSCETYRSYVFSKLQGDTATVNWQFTYSAGKKPGGSDLSKDVPVSGKGKGWALIDIARHCVLSAGMDFTTPVAALGDVSVTWIERAEFSLVGCK